MLALKPTGGLHDLVVQRLSAGPLGDADRLLIEAAADEVVGLIRSFLPHHDGSLIEAVRRFHDDDWMAGSRFADGREARLRGRTSLVGSCASRSTPPSAARPLTF